MAELRAELAEAKAAQAKKKAPAKKKAARGGAAAAPRRAPNVHHEEDPDEEEEDLLVKCTVADVNDKFARMPGLSRLEDILKAADYLPEGWVQHEPHGGFTRRDIVNHVVSLHNDGLIDIFLY